MLLDAFRPAMVLVPLLLFPVVGGCGARDSKPAARARDSVSEWRGHGVCYGPHRDGQSPGGPSPTRAQIREDLHLMRPHWSLVRLYGSSEFAARVLDVIRADELELQVLLGVWVAAETRRDEQGTIVERLPDAAAANRRELDAAIALAAEYPQLILAVCVGNETQVSWSPHPCDLELLIEQVRRVREAIALPVTAADDYQYWLTPESRQLAREVDFITLHAHPLWNGKQLDEALAWLGEQVDAVRAIHPDRPVAIGETGWATSVADHGEQARLIQGVTGEAEQAIFYEAVREWSAEAGLTTFFFEAFDENWKGGDDPAEVEKHWGLLQADRTPKLALTR